MLSVESLLDFSAPDCYGMTIMHYLAWSGYTSLETFKRCFQKCPMPATAVGKGGKTMLHFAAERGNIPIVEYLLKNYANEIIHIRDNTGGTAIHSAVRSKRAARIIDTLVAYGADLWSENARQETALHCAFRVGNSLTSNAVFSRVNSMITSSGRASSTLPRKLELGLTAHPLIQLFLDCKQPCLGSVAKGSERPAAMFLDSFSTAENNA